jgi:uncharacterized protein
MEKRIEGGLHVMVKPRGAVCNLDCAYCYYLSKELLYPGSRSRMAEELLESYTRQYIEAQSGPEVTFAWQGGEPTLMGIEFFEKAIALQKKYARAGMRILNALQTNGVNLNDEWGRFFHDNNFLIGISIDGPAELHDVYRVDKGGKATFERVMRGVEVLKRQRVEFNALTCVQRVNSKQPLKVYRFLRDEVGARFMQFIPIVERVNETGFQEGERVTRRSVKAKQYGRFLIEVFDEWAQRDIGQVYVQIFDVALGAWMGQPGGLCVFAPTCGKALALEHNGDLYACDHYVEPKYLLGNIQETHLIELASSPKQQRFGQDKLDGLPQYCLRCAVRFACHGECPKNRFIMSPDGEAGLNYLCEGYKAFFTHIDPAMRRMAEEIRRQGGLP